jgi:hypothetical protein
MDQRHLEMSGPAEVPPLTIGTPVEVRRDRAAELEQAAEGAA